MLRGYIWVILSRRAALVWGDIFFRVAGNGLNCQLSIVNSSVSGKMGTKKPELYSGIVENIH